MLNEFEQSEWISVYQQASFNNALAKLGLPNSEITTEDGKKLYFFSWDMDDPIQTAWEVSSGISLREIVIPGDRMILHLVQQGNIDEIEWDNLETNSYITPIVKGNVGASYSKRYRRSLKKADPNLRSSQAETDTQIANAINFLNGPDHPERRDHFNPLFFQSLVLALLANSVAEVHVVYNENRPDLLLGSAVVLKSPNQVNFRWYSNKHEAGIGHFFMQRLIDTFLSKEEINVVNLSGMPQPHEQKNDLSLKGIAEFKKQITDNFVIFSPASIQR